MNIYQDKNILEKNNNYECFDLFSEIISENSTEPSSHDKVKINYKEIGKQKEITDNAIELTDGSFLIDGKKINFIIDSDQIRKNGFKIDYPLCNDKNRVYISIENHINHINSTNKTNKGQINDIIQKFEVIYPYRNLLKLKNGEYIYAMKMDYIMVLIFFQVLYLKNFICFLKMLL